MRAFITSSLPAVGSQASRSTLGAVVTGVVSQQQTHATSTPPTSLTSVVCGDEAHVEGDEHVGKEDGACS